jgi:cephalosporin hydroxylase
MIIKKDVPFVRINNILADQTLKALDLFTEFLLNEQFELVIEIGSGRGGFTEFLYAHCSKLISYDITSERNESNNGNIDFRVADCLDETTVNEINKEIEKCNKVLVLCDGGNKELEVKLFSSMLKSGSYVMCHDYCFTQESYDNFIFETLWPTQPESYYKNLESTLEKNKLSKAKNHNDFSSAFWGCFIKD